MNKTAIMPSRLAAQTIKIDHLAIAVTNLEESLNWFTSVLGFELKERRKVAGTSTGMISATLKAGPIDIVLLEGIGEESQVSRYVAKYGPGVQHVALSVTSIEGVVKELSSRGLCFDTSLIEGPGLKQIFSTRDQGSGIMLEIIERGVEGFSDQNVNALFDQLEKKGSF